MSLTTKVVVGCPGSGKSTFLARIAGTLPPNNTLILSYSRSASASIAEKAGPNYKSSTIHALCFHNVGATPQQMLRGRQIDEFCKRIKVPPVRKEHDGYNPYMHRFEVYDWARTTGADVYESYFRFSDMVDFTFIEYAFFVKALLKYKDVYGGYEFHDLLNKFSPEEAPENLLIDEAQDNSYSLTMAVEKLVMKGVKRLWIVGDPNQAIYTYSGADPKYMNHFGGDEQFLDQSYRCPCSVVIKAKTLLPAEFKPTDSMGEVTRESNFPDKFDMVLVRTNFLKKRLSERVGIPLDKISTIHKAKGKQANHVVLYNTTTRKVRSSYEIDPVAEKRVMYTAITRAREKLTIFDGGFPNDWI